MVSLEIVNSYYTDMGVTSSLLTLQKKGEKSPEELSLICLSSPDSGLMSSLNR